MPFFFGGKYTDFTREWFAEVGSAFIRMMAAQTVLPYMVDQGRMVIRYLWMRLRMRNMVSQHDLDELFSPPDFDLPPRYGEYHATLFVAFTLSSGIPIMMHFLCAFLLFGFVSDRIALLRLSERPEPTDESLSILSLDIVPFAAILHFAFGVWMFGAASGRYVNGGPSYDTGTQAVDDLVMNADLSLRDQFNPRKRIFKMAALPQFVGFVVVVSILMVRMLATPVARYVKSFQNKKRRVIWEDVTALPPLNVVMPQYMHRKKKGAKAAGSQGDLAKGQEGKDAAEPAGPSVLVKNVVFADDGRPIQWKGALNYDMTTDHRHVESFARMSESGKLSEAEAMLFTVFDHGRRGKRPPKPKESRMTRKETIRAAENEERGEFTVRPAPHRTALHWTALHWTAALLLIVLPASVPPLPRAAATTPPHSNHAHVSLSPPLSPLCSTPLRTAHGADARGGCGCGRHRGLRGRGVRRRRGGRARAQARTPGSRASPGGARPPAVRRPPARPAATR